MTPEAGVFDLARRYWQRRVDDGVHFRMILKKGLLFAGMTTYVVPVLALFWGTFDHEMISPLQAIAIAGVLGMVALVQTGVHSEEEVIEPAAAGDVVTSLPLSAEAEYLVSLPATEIPYDDRRQRRNMQVA
ncbi:MAG: hypothetical protein U0805_13575 [Pirellulales bacterium]